MELSGSLIPAPRPISAPRGFYRLPFGAFSLPQPPSRVVGAGYSRALRPRQEWVEGWVQSNDTLVRGLPILIGGSALVAVLLSRAFFGIAAVADASSSPSRADILTLALSVTDILAGLVWLSIRPKSIYPVVPRGVERKRVGPGVSFLLFKNYFGMDCNDRRQAGCHIVEVLRSRLLIGCSVQHHLPHASEHIILV